LVLSRESPAFFVVSVDSKVLRPAPDLSHCCQELDFLTLLVFSFAKPLSNSRNIEWPPDVIPF
jgi:hypothetical protein